jgi:hypothetical protein
MNIATDPQLSRQAAQAVQGMPAELRVRFVNALEKAKSKSDLSKDFQDYLVNGYKPDKVMPTLEEALKQVIIEWKD